ncbi:MAG: GTP pyrophosphokinase family protein [Lachnospiraceae bacterium]|nr:GTP pyrophosphokinase family protein [Lachnospiraceae bacterium]
MTDIYGEKREALESLAEELSGAIHAFRMSRKEQDGDDPVEHVECRIKSDESMREKLRRKGFEETQDNAIHAVHDAVGIRVVCSFLKDVYAVRDHLVSLPEYEVAEEKDYIRHVKPNGYRSYHLILKCHGDLYAEVQIRTISMDTWAALEHHMKYKKSLNENVPLIEAELKRCADELASTDLSMQTIKDMITGA